MYLQIFDHAVDR